MFNVFRISLSTKLAIGQLVFCETYAIDAALTETLTPHIPVPENSVKSLCTIIGEGDVTNANMKNIDSRTVALDLSSNDIQHVSSDAFDGLPNLRYLNLNSNHQLQLYGNTSFIQHSRLEIIECTLCDIRNLTSKMFEFLPNLRNLNLAGNYISSIEETTFLNNTLLQTLILDFNSILTMSAKIVQQLSNLETLCLDYNHFYASPENRMLKTIYSRRKLRTKLCRNMESATDFKFENQIEFTVHPASEEMNVQMDEYSSFYSDEKEEMELQNDEDVQLLAIESEEMRMSLNNFKTAPEVLETNTNTNGKPKNRSMNPHKYIPHFKFIIIMMSVIAILISVSVISIRCNLRNEQSTSEITYSLI